MMCQESGHDFLTSVMDFVNLVLSGRRPSEVAPIFFGGRLLAMNKKSGGIRPLQLALLFGVWRLSAQILFGINRLGEYLYPNQLGAGTPGGCEADIHSARRYLEALTPDDVLVKLDFTNAFNSLYRHDMLLSVHSRIPEIYAYCHSAYDTDVEHTAPVQAAVLLRLSWLRHQTDNCDMFCFMANTPSHQKRLHNRGIR